jgi:endonuclease YncB( thermonuclease family)
VPYAIHRSRAGYTVGRAGLGLRRNRQGDVEHVVHDGDTVVARAVDNLGIRLLGVDAPERSFPLPGSTLPFVDIDDERWRQVLADPFASRYGPFDPPLQPELVQELEKRVGPEAAANHARFAMSELAALTGEVAGDQQALGKTDEEFLFFLAFGYEVVDRYGRLLCYLHPDQPEDAEWKDSYNDRLLQAGVVVPYFIWPNIDPFFPADTIDGVVPAPGRAPELARKSRKLRRARDWTREARADARGVYARGEPLAIMPFELRFLSRREPPDRWVIDLSAESDRLIAPQRYHTVPNPEDRLLVPPEFVALFTRVGWVVEDADAAVPGRAMAL